MNTVKECFDVILCGDKEKSRLAARKIRKLVYGSSSEGEKYRDIKKIIDDAPQTYSGISEDWRQENFIMAISVIYFLHNRENQPDFLFPWLFQLLQHPNGYIRQAVVRMISNEIGPLTVHIRCPELKLSIRELKPEHADNILRSLHLSLDGLLSFLWKPEYKRYKYIDSLPPSPYKSAQMVLAELEDSCEDNYFNDIEKK